MAGSATKGETESMSMGALVLTASAQALEKKKQVLMNNREIRGKEHGPAPMVRLTFWRKSEGLWKLPSLPRKGRCRRHRNHRQVLSKGVGV